MLEKLGSILRQFRIESPITFYEQIKNGNINKTYKADTSGGDSYIIQKVNTGIFRDPIGLMKNIESVTDVIRERMTGGIPLLFEQTVSGNSYHIDEEGGFWRVCNYIDSVTFNHCSDPHIIRNTGTAFGQFQNALSNFDASGLNVTIPDFHNTIARYDTLEESIRKDTANRVKYAVREIEGILSLKEQSCKLEKMYRSGELPLRVTHNDTKINNVLFDSETHNALTVIDLDTVMPGLVGHDFGDAIRFAANFVEEDSPAFERSGIDLNIFRAFSEGFLSETKNALTENEIDTLALSCLAMTSELVVRFLTDYLDGDVYFKLNYPEHNIVRTRCQLALAMDINRRMKEMELIVKETASHA